LSAESRYRQNTGGSSRAYLISDIGDNYNKITYLNNASGNDYGIDNPRKLHTFLKYKRAKMNELNNVVVEVTIPGNSDIEIGQVVNLHIRQMSSFDETARKWNILYGQEPKFLITAVKQVYNRANNNYFTVMQCIKDTYAITPTEIK
jgi:hypothetical protein